MGFKISSQINPSTAMSTPSKKTVLRTSDDEIFEVAETVAKGSQIIKNMMEDGCAGAEIPLPNVTGNTLAKVIEYLEFHHGRDGRKPSDAELKSFDSALVKLDQAGLFDLVLAANFLDIKSLMDLCCQTIADTIKDKSPEWMRSYFRIKNDFPPEEEEELRRQNAWVFE